MDFSIRRSTSKRFFQLGFEGFRPKGRNKIEQFFNIWLNFFKSLVRYFYLKVADLLNLFSFIFKYFLGLPIRLKNFTIKKLIWSRGKLGRPVATAGFVSFAFLAFLFGEVFSSSKLVVKAETGEDYLMSVSDITPKKETALTTLPAARQRNEPFVYQVEGGDSLYSIGNKFKISVDAIKYINGLTDSSVLTVGQNLTIPPVSGLIHTVKSGDTLTSIAQKFDVPVQAIADFNYLLDTTHLDVGTELVIPGGKVPEVIIPAIPNYVSPSIGSSGASPNKGLCAWPTTVRIITQYFSWYHNGVDIATGSGSAMPPLLACTDGIVVRAGWDPFGLGLHIQIEHGNGYTTVYGHMSRLDVSYGEKVSKGQIIGLMGNTGRSTGPHVHFMVKYNGVAQNPLNFTQ